MILLCSAPVGVRPLPLTKLVDDFAAQWEYVANEGTTFTFKTNLSAPRYRSVATLLSPLKRQFLHCYDSCTSVQLLCIACLRLLLVRSRFVKNSACLIITGTESFYAHCRSQASKPLWCVQAGQDESHSSWETPHVARCHSPAREGPSAVGFCTQGNPSYQSILSPICSLRFSPNFSS